MVRKLFLLVLLMCPAAHAQFAVIDVASVLQLIIQLKVLQQQLDQAKSEFDSITGSRGMERLLTGTVRNYLPKNWQELTAALDGAQFAYSSLSQEIRSLGQANAILTATQLSRLSKAERREVDAARNSAATLQAVARRALTTSSDRFAAIQQLIDAIRSANDQKAVLELQARISAEHSMLANENTKLTTLFQSVQAEEWARKQREREASIASIGSLRNLPRMGL